MNMSDRIVILNEGRILQSGPPEALYNAPDSRFVADFLGRANFLEGEIGVIDDGAVSISRGGETVSVPAPERAVPTQGAILAVRPERITVRAPGTDTEGRNTLSGRVLSATFNGAQLIYRVDTVFGEIMAIEPSFRAEKHLEREAAAIVSWPRHAGVLLQGD